jgi:formylglycine-generating enzyme required for sulfatase activity
MNTHPTTRRHWLGALCAAALLVVAIPAPTALAQQPGSTFRDCDDCPEMVVIPADNFMMGIDKDFDNPSDTEMPRHRVTIARPFAIGKTEVTQAEWVAVMGNNPSKFKGRSRPVEQVSWKAAQNFIRRLNAKTGKTYRLPTEAEWEYAARAGTDSAWSWGNDAGQAGQYAWFQDNAGQETHPVGQLQPNRFGLYDMHGNVYEWVQDCWHDDYRGAPTNGSFWQEIAPCDRVDRGGSWYDDPSYIRSAYRNYGSPGSRDDNLGFRLARTLP